MCESGISVGGSLQFCQDTRIDLSITRSHRDLSTKQPYLLQDAGSRRTAYLFQDTTSKWMEFQVIQN
jgi:hypothetical protein